MKELLFTEEVTDEEYAKFCDFIYDCEIATAIAMTIIGIIWRIFVC